MCNSAFYECNLFEYVYIAMHLCYSFEFTNVRRQYDLKDFASLLVQLH